MSKDWTGNQNSIYKTLGASNHTEKERQVDDYYATEPYAVDVLLSVEDFSNNIYEPAVGGGHMADALINHGYTVECSDIVDRGYSGTYTYNFLEREEPVHNDIITNPPYKYAKEFVEHSLELVDDGNKVAMFLKLQFMEGKARKKLFTEHPPKTIYVSSSRLLCAKNGKFDEMRASGGSAVAYAWYVWVKGYQGDTVVKWVN